MERKLKILSYLTLIFTALVGLGEILTYVILDDIDLASIMIFALVISFTFSLLFFFHKMLSKPLYCMQINRQKKGEPIITGSP